MDTLGAIIEFFKARLNNTPITNVKQIKSLDELKEGMVILIDHNSYLEELQLAAVSICSGKAAIPKGLHSKLTYVKEQQGVLYSDVYVIPSQVHPLPFEITASDVEGGIVYTLVQRAVNGDMWGKEK